MTGLPIIVFDGNCHAHHLAAIFAGAGLAETYTVGDDWGFVPSFRGTIANYVSPHVAHQVVEAAVAAGRPVYQSSQVFQLTGPQVASYTPLVHRVARHPQMELYACSPDIFAQRFGSRQPLKRILRLDLDTIAQCQKHCDTPIDFVSVISDELPKGPLFHCTGHPGGLLTSLLFRCVADQLNIFDATAVAAVEADLRANEAINFESDPGYPVPQSVLDELGFLWPDWYPLYREMVQAGKDKQHQQWLARHAEYQLHFSNDTQYWRFLTEAALGVGDGTIAATATERLTSICPGWTPGWSKRFLFWRDQDAMEEANRVTEDCKAFFGIHRQLYGILAGFEFRNGRPDAAIALARTFAEKTISKADGVLLVVAFMLWAHRRDDAIQEAHATAAGLPDNQKTNFSKSLQRFGLDLQFA